MMTIPDLSWSLHIRSPVRVDLAGGTLDIWPIWSVLRDVVTVNLAINRYQRIILEPAPAWLFVNGRNGQTWHPQPGQGVPTAWRLVWSICNAVPDLAPLRVTVTSEVPPGSGLGGSSALAVGLLRGLAEVKGLRLKRDQLVQWAMDLETAQIEVPTGAQDYLAAVYGGLNAWAWTWSGWQRRSLARAARWATRRMLVVFVGESRFSGSPNWEIFRRFFESDEATRRRLATIARAALQMVDALRARDARAVARALHIEMDARAELHEGIVTDAVARVLEWRAAGVLAGKVCGAGGGGSVLLWVEPEAKARLVQEAREQGWLVFEPLAPAAGLRLQRRVL